MSGQDSRRKGRWGEELAAKYLRDKGYSISAANWRCRLGEVDLIAEDGTYLCFVEVKLRKSAAYGSAAAFVDRRKQDRLRAAALLYLSQRPVDLQPRFDVIEIYAAQGEATPQPEIIHLENAFS